MFDGNKGRFPPVPTEVTAVGALSYSAFDLEWNPAAVLEQRVNLSDNWIRTLVYSHSGGAEKKMKWMAGKTEIYPGAAVPREQ